MKNISLITALALSTASVVAAPAPLPDPSKLPPASKQEGVTFEKDIHPLMEDYCVRCHGDERPKNGLKLTTQENALKGSKEHKDVVVPGHSEQSRLVFAVAEINGKIYMPPKPRPPRGPNGGPNGPGPNGPGPNGPGPNAAGPNAAGPNGPQGGPGMGPMHPWKPLTPEQVGLIRAWIDQGAK